MGSGELNRTLLPARIHSLGAVDTAYEEVARLDTLELRSRKAPLKSGTRGSAGHGRLCGRNEAGFTNQFADRVLKVAVG